MQKYFRFHYYFKIIFPSKCLFYQKKKKKKIDLDISSSFLSDVLCLMDGSFEEVPGLLFNEVLLLPPFFCLGRSRTIVYASMNWDMKYAEDTRYVDFSSCFFNIPLFSVATRSCESNSRVIQLKIGSSEIEKQPRWVVTLRSRSICFINDVILDTCILIINVYERDIKKNITHCTRRRLER